MSGIPADRIRVRNDAPVRPGGDYVLYWMIANRRTRSNFALERAVEHVAELGKPLLVLEPLRVDYPYASERIHAFVMEGMRDNEAAFAKAGVRYFPYVEPEVGAGRGLLEALAARACVVITDDWPSFFLPQMVDAAAARLPVRLEAVDACGLLPLCDERGRVPDRVRLPPVPPEEAPRTPGVPAEPHAARAADVARPSSPAARRDEAVACRSPGAGRSADRPRGLARAYAARRCGGRAAAPEHFLEEWAGALRRRPQSPGSLRHERPVALPALRPRLYARDLRGHGPCRDLDARRPLPTRGRKARGLVGHVGERRGVPRPGLHVAGARFPLPAPSKRRRAVRGPPGLGAGHTDQARKRRARPHVLRPRNASRRRGRTTRSGTRRSASSRRPA